MDNTPQARSDQQSRGNGGCPQCRTDAKATAGKDAHPGTHPNADGTPTGTPAPTRRTQQAPPPAPPPTPKEESTRDG